MRRMPIRRAWVTWGLLFLTCTATLASGAAAGLRVTPVTVGSSPLVAGARDDVGAVATAPARTAEWATNQLRGAGGGDRLLVVLVAVTAFVVALAWRRVPGARLRSHASVRGCCSGIRGPPCAV